MTQRHPNDSVHRYMSDVTSRIVAQSGIPSDRYHLGKMIFQSLKEDPEFITQIDGSTDDLETNASVLKRSIRCAVSFQNIGLNFGDVIVLMAPSHIDLAIPFYAALYLGIIISPVDRKLTVNELQNTFSISKPKLIFCQSEKATDIQVALNEIDHYAQLICFDKGDYLSSFEDFLEQFGDYAAEENFKPADFDPEDANAFLIPTSGTTGLPKSVAATQKNFAVAGPYWWNRFTDFPCPTEVVMVASPLQWITAMSYFTFTPIIRSTRLQTSSDMTQEHAYHLINTYKPTCALLSPTMLTTLIRSGDRDECDFTSFEMILLGGSPVPHALLEEMQEISPKTEVFNVYGMSELTGIGFQPHSTPGSCGKPMGCFQYRIVNVETEEDILEPEEQGELWMKGPTVFKEYYNNPEATEDTFAEGRWLKTGDIFYRDENWNYFFVDRFKLLLKYKGHHISPVEVEGVIRQHPGVFDVAVTGIPDPDVGDLAVACVVPRPDCEVTADEIKDLVKESLTDSKQLRGGVVFLEAIPMTTSTKVHRRQLKEMVLEMERE